jgi:glutamate racemase
LRINLPVRRSKDEYQRIEIPLEPAGFFYIFDSMKQGPIGVFDSGYGGLTVLRNLVNTLPAYDFLYLGDNARAPYGTRSFETVYNYTRESVEWFFEQHCPLVILACNTASAKALRTIQQKDLIVHYPNNRVLGVIRPTAEVIGTYTKSRHIGILATPGTVQSCSYPIEIGKFFPELKVVQQACPMWVPLIENNETDHAGSAFFVKQCLDALLAQDPKIDTILLGCTHYPVLEKQIKQFLPEQIQLISQGSIVADSLKDYLFRHPEMEQRLSKSSQRLFYTTDSPEDFDRHAPQFFGTGISSQKIILADNRRETASN